MIAAIMGAATASASAAANATEEEEWSDRITLSGDLRLRYEEIKRESREKRDRARYRARVALAAQITDSVDVVLQLASGADDPVSRNVTFDGGFSADDIGFDLAYVDWTPTLNLHVLAGKMKNPLYRAGGGSLIWDGDLNPEGLALTYQRQAFFATAARFWVEERSDSESSVLNAIEAGARIDLGEFSGLTVGAGYFVYTHTVGNEPFYNGNEKGNSVDLLGNYLYDYEITEVFAAFETRLGNLPMSIFADWTMNNEVDEQDTGWAYGAKLGAANSAGTWEASWAFQDVEADTVIGTFSDSDFGGGRTDADGHIIKARYALAKSVFVGGALFINRINRFKGPEEDYDRLQLDVEFRFK